MATNNTLHEALMREMIEAVEGPFGSPAGRSTRGTVRGRLDAAIHHMEQAMLGDPEVAKAFATALRAQFPDAEGLSDSDDAE